VEQRRLGAERHLADIRVAVARVAERRDLAAVVRVESGERGQVIERDVRAAVDRVHRGQEARGELLDVADEASGSSNGRWRISKSNVQSRGTMLSAVPPRMSPTCAVVYGTSYASSRFLRSRNSRARLRDVRDDLARDLHRVDAARRERRVRLEAAHAAAPRLLALVRDHELHAGGLADDARRGRTPRATMSAISRRTPMHPTSSSYDSAKCRACRRRGDELRHEREPHRGEALHVGHAAAVQPAVAQR
jgi:hypothetical protein